MTASSLPTITPNTKQTRMRIGKARLLALYCKCKEKILVQNNVNAPINCQGQRASAKGAALLVFVLMEDCSRRANWSHCPTMGGHCPAMLYRIKLCYNRIDGRDVLETHRPFIWHVSHTTTFFGKFLLDHWTVCHWGSSSTLETHCPTDMTCIPTAPSHPNSL